MKLSLIFNNKHLLILILAFFIYISYFTVATFLRYDNFYTGRFDLGNMDQTVWNTLHGRIFETSNIYGEIISRLTSHADFLLILLSPLYLIWEHPKMLLLIQTFVLGTGSFFVYDIAQNILKNKNFSLIFAIAYLLNPAVQYTNLYDFHSVTLATTFLLAAFYFMQKSKYVLLTFFLVLSGLTKEQVWLTVSIFGLYILFKKEKKYKKFGMVFFAIGLLLFYLLIWHIIPNVSGSNHFALSYYSGLGDSPTSVVKNFFLSPVNVFTTIFTGSRLDYIQQLLLPLGFLSIFSPLFLLFALPDLLINLLSSNSQLHQIYYQYSAVISPFIFISTLYGVKNLISRFPKFSTFFIFYLLFSTFYAAYLYGPLPFSKAKNIDMFVKPQKNKMEIEKVVSRIPSKYSVSATNNIGSHLSHRQKLYNVPFGIDEADFVVFLLDDHFAQPSLKEQYQLVERVVGDKNYNQVLKIDNFILFEKLVK